ncbi:MAG: N-acetyl-gamma-glutamyl-phosphate reductase [Elusimicrobia bacterium]|nr:N-acetyl-gamma-glutamyl-phosphate reductase [Candidatus Liberimonas magnetica]
MNKINVAIAGIKGYTGEVLLEILSSHEGVKLALATSRLSGKPVPVKEIYPDLGDINLMCENLDVEVLAKKTDIVFLALPHKVSLELVPEFLKHNVKVIDLSADFRLNSAEVYEKWYGGKHSAPHVLKDAVYGLPEFYAKDIKNAKLIANPGCYPTTVILGCAPALRNGLVDTGSIIADAKSGVSGAGRNFSKEYFQIHHPDHRAYNIAGKHRHIPEMEQELSKIAKKEITLTFTPHIIPVERGMLSTIYMNLSKKTDVKAMVKIYKEFYKDKPFIRVLDEGEIPNIKSVVYTNYCDIGLDIDQRTNRLIVVSCIDNLVKGASGQAVQNMNIMCGFDEKMGLVLCKP